MTARAKQVPGYHATVTLSDAVIVVARSYWQARKALDRVKVDYDRGHMAELDSAQVSQRLLAGVDEPGASARNDGDAAQALSAGCFGARGGLRGTLSRACLHGADELHRARR